MTDDAVLTRRREIAVEHILFKLMGYVEQRDPGLLDLLEASLDHLGDSTHDASKDDEAVREIARRMIAGARHEAGAIS
jgi:cytochrome P450